MILVFEHDDGSLHVFASESDVRSHLEAIDVENREYEFIDHSGQRFIGEIVSPVTAFSPGDFRLSPLGEADPRIVSSFLGRARILDGDRLGLHSFDDLLRKIQSEQGAAPNHRPAATFLDFGIRRAAKGVTPYADRFLGRWQVSLDVDHEMSARNRARIYIAPFYYDDDLIQCQLFASNGAYSGYTEPYITRDSFRRTGELLTSFPKDGILSEVIWTFSETVKSPESSFRFFIRDLVGHAGIRITLRRQLKEMEEASFLFCTEVAAINHFGKQLCDIASKEEFTQAVVVYQDE